MTIDAKTTLCAVIGNPIGHSLSPTIHNAAFQATNLNFCYTAFEVSDVEQAIQGMRGLGIRGFSITIPHKVTAMQFADELDPVAESIGSINTLINNDGVLKGYNTDGIGALRALESAGIALEGAEATILGSGGAARAIACTLAAKSDLAKLNILGVVEDEVKNLHKNVAKQTSAKVVGELINSETLEAAMANTGILINCTPIGMHPKVDESVVPPHLMSAPLVVFDIVYNPMETKLLKEAKGNRCRTINGAEMFINQAIVQFELFTGQNAPEAVMRKVVLSSLKG
ncbi:MAG: shikimate dehydrogenase [Candidatus Omnitrophica bacterium]|nr:shikimate dehydrogenase [Candidatus Omnitrophota bacterium]MCA9431248.1 shikimate dehydrogenase [Candidatus Omnitrophota bacterium]MCB9768392.1 shikimate dehydrogenase [Candidatus Omnitrophota bacterium]MCB9783114.1 shikimate dehydrogenase [Candidatus Omnitrophota bacterium]